MANVSFIQTVESKLVDIPYTEGAVYWCTDSGKIFADQVVNETLTRIQYCSPNAESDPIFTNSPAYGITQSQIDRWDGIPNILFDTKSNWDSQTQLVSTEHTIYVYTDNRSYNSKSIAGIKIGDGNAYLIDLAFLDDIYWDHINNSSIHVTSLEKQNWNDKVTCFVSPVDTNMLVFTKDNQIS